MSKDQLIFATACLFTIAIISGCASSSMTSDSGEQPAATEVAAESSESTTTAATTETTESETADVTEVPPAIAEETTVAAITEENGVTIIPLGATPPAEPEEKIATPDIPEIAKELASHHNTLWHSGSFTYRLYLGGHLNAEYSEQKSALKINAEDDRADLACEYSTKHGGLASLDDTTVSACNKLANELQSYLAED